MHLSLFPELEPSPPPARRSTASQPPQPAPVGRWPSGRVAQIWQQTGFRPYQGCFVQFNAGVGYSLTNKQYRCISRPFGWIQQINETTQEALIYIPAHPTAKLNGHDYWIVPYRDLLPIQVGEDLFDPADYKRRLTRPYTGPVVWDKTPKNA